MVFRTFRNSCFGLIVLGAGLVGCGGSNTNVTTGPGIRVVNGLSSVTTANVLSGNVVISTALPYGTISGTPNLPYAIVPFGVDSINLANASTPNTSVASTSLTINSAGQNFDAIAYNATTPTFLILQDSLAVPSTANIRFVNASTASGSVDMVFVPPANNGLGSSATLVPGTVFPAQTTIATYQQFITPATNNYTLNVYPAGHDTGTPLATASVNMAVGVTWTFILLDPATVGGTPVLLQVQDNQLHDSAV